MPNEKTLVLVYNLFMQYKNNPLSPHLQIYKWQISSLLSIAHRIVGVINIIAITVICIWSLLLLGIESYQPINFFLNTFFGKFIAVSLCWTFSFHILNELRHLIWDLGYGFDLKVSNIIQKKYGKGDILFARNVIAHVKNIHELIDAAYNLISKDGIFSMDHSGIPVRKVLKELANRENTLTKSIFEKYGKCNIEPETGKITNLV